YEEPENKVIEELKEVGKPFIMILNSTHPTEQSTELLRQELRETHDVPVIAMNVEMMNEHDVTNVLREALFEFPVLEVNVNLPNLVIVLHDSHWHKQNYSEVIESNVRNINRIRDVDDNDGEYASFE